MQTHCCCFCNPSLLAFLNTWGVGFPSTIRVISSGLKDAKGVRSNSRV